MNQVAQLEQQFREAGFTLIRKRKHLVWRCPCGHAQITSSGSPCRGRGIWNSQALMKRTLRECTPTA